MMPNRPEFHVVDMACLFLGATPVSVYNSSSPEQVRYIASHSGGTIAIVDSPEYLERFLKIGGELRGLAHHVILDDPDHLAPADTIHFHRLAERPPLDWEAEANAMQPADLATMIYTSGTTGPPKAVMISHRNICWTVESLLRALGHTLEGFRTVSYLPMAHIAERMTSHYIHVIHGTEVTSCPDAALLPDYLREVKPQLFFAVPRVWEKAHSTVVAFLASDPEREAALHRAIELGLEAARARVLGHQLEPAVQAEWEKADAETLSVLRSLLGLDQCEVAVTAAAPTPKKIVEFFLGAGVPITELYGLSESCGSVTWEHRSPKPGTCGRAIPGCEVRLADDGEILARGGNVFVGYLNAPEQQDEVLDAEGWLHTGDIGKLDDEGYLTIVDRKKELIINAAGKNLSPANLESALRSTALIGQACVIGDRRPYLVALLTLDPEVVPAWASAHRVEADNIADLARHPEVEAEIERLVGQVNAKVSRVEQIKRFAILDHEWPVDSDELTPTMKLKRNAISTKYAAEIDALYR